ncbi:MAG TPA: Gfo/Idh/MocA family oxidoreductase [Solirubrobacterales bacterium]|jgi:predicted dehydrogenase|nr:Gfo/Idh/MocA family oxidoreductase [Solirubrobacterales bacterium]
MRLGIAGCGRIAERGYIPAALGTEGIAIAGFADPDAERREGCAALWARGGGGEAPAFAGAAELLAAVPIDLLVVAAHAAHHLTLAEEAAGVGVRSLVEKPPAPDVHAARRLAALDPQPLVAFNRRFLQGQELRGAVPAEGWLELDLELRFRRGDWGAHQADDEALLDAGLHLIDLACHLSAAAPIAVRHARIEPERASLELELARGRARIACATDRGHREVVAVRDRSGKLLAKFSWGGLHTRVGGLLGRPDPLVLSLRRQLEALNASVPAYRGQLRRVATADDGAVAMAVVEAARRSAALDGAEVTVAPLAGASR